MKLRGHSNGLAVALAAVAVVLAMSGTAYAVAVTTVNIADPGNPSRVAKVDAAGRLNTTGPLSNLDVLTNFAFDTTSALTSPTTAQLAVSVVTITSPALNSQFSGSTFDLGLVKIHAGTAGTCTQGDDGVYTERYLGLTLVDPGDSIVQTYPAPLVVKPTGTAKYCLGIQVGHVGGTQTSLYLSTFQLAGYVVAGSYTGLGLDTAAGAATAPKTRLVTR